jgi:hypothetical protein
MRDSDKSVQICRADLHRKMQQHNEIPRAFRVGFLWFALFTNRLSETPSIRLGKHRPCTLKGSFPSQFVPGHRDRLFICE